MLMVVQVYRLSLGRGSRSRGGPHRHHLTGTEGFRQEGRRYHYLSKSNDLPVGRLEAPGTSTSLHIQELLNSQNTLVTQVTNIPLTNQT